MVLTISYFHHFYLQETKNKLEVFIAIFRSFFQLRQGFFGLNDSTFHVVNSGVSKRHWPAIGVARSRQGAAWQSFDPGFNGHDYIFSLWIENSRSKFALKSKFSNEKNKEEPYLFLLSYLLLIGLLLFCKILLALWVLWSLWWTCMIFVASSCHWCQLSL